MSTNNSAEDRPKATDPTEKKPRRGYETPEVVSHSGEDLIEELGPAQACYPFGGATAAYPNAK